MAPETAMIGKEKRENRAVSPFCGSKTGRGDGQGIEI